MGLGDGLEYLQDVRQFRGKLIWRCLARLLSFLGELFQQSGLVVGLVEDAGDGMLPGGADDVRDPVADQLVIRDAHGTDVTSVDRYASPSSRASRPSPGSF